MSTSASAGIEIDYLRAGSFTQSAAAAEFIAMEADWEAARLLTLQAAWMADNRKPNSLQASMAKAKAGRVGTEIALRCVALCGATGFGEGELLEKWARDAKILDLFEGTQQIQLLIIARTLLGVKLRRAQVALRAGAACARSRSQARAMSASVGRRMPDRQAQHQPAVEHGVGDEDLAGRVDPVHQRLVVRVGAVVTEADDAEVARRHDLPAGLLRRPTARTSARARPRGGCAAAARERP